MIFAGVIIAGLHQVVTVMEAMVGDAAVIEGGPRVKTRLQRFFPWHTRIAAKLVLSRLPASYSFWRRVHLFSHGSMHRFDYALGVFRHHFERLPAQRDGLVLMEIGPGDSLLSAVIGAAHGAKKIHLIDAGNFATAEMQPYWEAAIRLRELGLAAPDLDSAEDLTDVLAACNATYETGGLESLRQIPTGSVDFIWSQAVLEHVRREEFGEFAREMRRVLRPTGCCSHQVDLKDHLGGALNNMRLGSKLWEAQWMASSGFYTNRLRMFEVVKAFREAHFSVDVLDCQRWGAVPTPRHVLAREFQEIPDNELLVQQFDLIAAPV